MDNFEKKMQKSLTDLAEALGGETGSYSYKDFKNIGSLKDQMIVCASMMALRGAEPVSRKERDMIDLLSVKVDEMIQILKEL